VASKPVEVEFTWGIRDPNTGKRSKLMDYQREFVDKSDDVLIGAFSGEKGSGKTSTILYKISRNCVQAIDPVTFPEPLDPPWTVLFMHKKEEFVHSAIFQPLWSILPQTIPVKGREPISFILPGSTEQKKRLYWGISKQRHVVFRWMGMSDAEAIKNLDLSGENYDEIFLCQPDLIRDPAILTAMIGRIGRRNTDPLKHHIYMDPNRCRGWVYENFYKDKFPRDAKGQRQYYFQDSLTSQNVYTTSQYKELMEGFEQPSWENVKGLVYPAYSESTHVVRRAEIPVRTSWKIERACDRGFHPDPFAVVWMLQDHDGNALTIHEIERYWLTTKHKAEAIQAGDQDVIRWVISRTGCSEAEARAMITRYCYGPSDLSTKSEDLGVPLAELMYRDPRDPAWRGVEIEVVSIKHISKEGKEASRIENINTLLEPEYGHRHPITGQDNAPRLYFTEATPRLNAQIESAMKDPDNPYHMDKTAMINSFCPDPVTGRFTETHHWDLQEALSLQAQVCRLKNPPPPDTYKQTPFGQMRDTRLEKALRGETDRGF
jgi:hypothetical protein